MSSCCAQTDVSLLPTHTCPRAERETAESADSVCVCVCVTWCVFAVCAEVDAPE